MQDVNLRINFSLLTKFLKREREKSGKQSFKKQFLWNRKLIPK